jgi:uncharacterized protein YbcI
MSHVPIKSKGDVEEEIRQAMIRFEKEFMGRGPFETRTYLLDDMVLVRLAGVLTQAEIHLAQSEGGRHRQLVKQMRWELLEKGRPMLEAVILNITGIPVESIHTDISTKTGERIIIFHLKEELPPHLSGSQRSRVPVVARNGNSKKKMPEQTNRACEPVGDA